MHNDMLRKDAMCDRLSSLPDDLIHRILSFISVKDAIRTSLLSTRWRLTWTSMPDLNFENVPHLSEFISNVLSHRNNQTKVSSVSLELGRAVRDDESVSRLFNFTFSHNVQRLSLTRSDAVDCPYSFCATPRWDLPFLMTLHLHCVMFSDDDDGLFSKCTNLKNLLLRRCGMKATKVMEICHPRLSNLTLQHTKFDEVVNVVAPQLKNLTIAWCRGKQVVNAPGLTSLAIEGFQPWRLSTPTGFHSLDKVDLLMYDPDKADAHEIVSMFQHFHSVKLLTLNLEILERLSSSTKQFPHKAFAFTNAKISKFSPKQLLKVYIDVRAQEKVTRPSEITPFAIFPMISCQEMKAMRDMATQLGFVNHLGLLVKQCKADKNSDKAPPMCKPEFEIFWAWDLGWNLGEMILINRRMKFKPLEACLVMSQIKEAYSGRLTKKGTRPIVAWLNDMRQMFALTELLITKQMSSSQTDVMLSPFLSLCEDAVLHTKTMLRWIYSEEKNAILLY